MADGRHRAHVRRARRWRTASWLKHVAVVDLVLIASGFVLRAAAGRGRRRRADVEVVRARARCSARCSSSPASATPRCASIGDGAADVRGDARRRTRPAYLRLVLAMSCGAALDQLLPVGVRDQGARRQRPAVLRAVDRADADRAAALPAGARARPRRRAGGGVRQRPCAAAARAWPGWSVRARRCTCGERRAPSDDRPASPGRDRRRPASRAGSTRGAGGECSPTLRPRARRAARSSRSAASRAGRRSCSPRRARRARRSSRSIPTPATTAGPSEIDGFDAPRPRTTGRLRAQPRARPGCATASATCRPSQPTPTPRSTAPIDVLYIDGAHRYAPARADIRELGRAGRATAARC